MSNSPDFSVENPLHSERHPSNPGGLGEEFVERDDSVDSPLSTELLALNDIRTLLAGFKKVVDEIGKDMDTEISLDEIYEQLTNDSTIAKFIGSTGSRYCDNYIVRTIITAARGSGVMWAFCLLRAGNDIRIERLMLFCCAISPR
jgi:hypothetical protein